MWKDWKSKYKFSYIKYLQFLINHISRTKNHKYLERNTACKISCRLQIAINNEIPSIKHKRKANRIQSQFYRFSHLFAETSLDDFAHFRKNKTNFCPSIKNWFLDCSTSVDLRVSVNLTSSNAKLPGKFPSNMSKRISTISSPYIYF